MNKKKTVARYFDGKTDDKAGENGESSEQIETFTPDLSVSRRVVDKLAKKSKGKKKSVEEKIKKKEAKRLKKLKAKDPFPGEAPIPKEKVKKYKRGKQMKAEGIRTKFHRNEFEQKERQIELAVKQSARTERLLDETAGFLEADEGEHTADVTQHEIASAVDVTSATKFFELKLEQFGPYRLNYTRNGRHLLLGGKKGHVAAIDWSTRKLLCELNVMETVADVQWLHTETMFAVAQKQWTYIYDNQGIELHCLKALDQVLRLEFLPYHFLLASASARGYLSYLDVSVGKKVAGYTTGLGRLDVMCQNPRSAILHLGHTGGTVTLWSPNVKEPLVKMLCHGGGTRSITVDATGNYMATGGIDRKLKLWDLRMFRPLAVYSQQAGAGELCFSQRGLLAGSYGNVVEIYRDPRPAGTVIDSPYLVHRLRSPVTSLGFCPYEDVVGVGHGDGFSSILAPGAGEANYDALEANPYQTKKQRQQAEVKQLLEKVPVEMIHLDTTALGKLDMPTLEQRMAERQKVMFLKPDKIEFEPKYKKKGRSKTGRLENRKKGVKFEHKQAQIREHARRQSKEQSGGGAGGSGQQQQQEYSVFDRFKTSA